ncbi:MAG TPA: hypothetical protein VEF55_05550 [Candidatus Binatia bacterium]|nr:hypothetical protein [Candidatus Binatia bacterium]
MNKPKPPIFTEHRRKRLTLWALTVLGWLMSVLFGDRDVSFRHLKQRLDYVFLDELTGTTRALLIARALQFAKVRMPRRLHYWKHGRSLRRAHFMRSFLGAHFRRLLTHRDLKTHIAQLIDVLRKLDSHARRLAQRMRTLHRLWRIVPPIAPAALILGPPARLVRRSLGGGGSSALSDSS